MKNKNVKNILPLSLSLSLSLSHSLMEGLSLRKTFQGFDSDGVIGQEEEVEEEKESKRIRHRAKIIRAKH